VLGAILRVADGLDRTHTGVVRRVRCTASAGRIRLDCRTAGPAEAERLTALEKADLLVRVFGRPCAVVIRGAVAAQNVNRQGAKTPRNHGRACGAGRTKNSRATG
jgi:hypothetical protein